MNKSPDELGFFRKIWWALCFAFFCFLGWQGITHKPLTGNLIGWFLILFGANAFILTVTNDKYDLRRIYKLIFRKKEFEKTEGLVTLWYESGEKKSEALLKVK